MSLTQWVKFKPIFCAQILNQCIFFSLWAKPTKALGKTKHWKGFQGRPSIKLIYTYIYLEPKVVVLLLHGIVTTTYFIQWQHHWRHFNLKDGIFACKWHKVPNISHAKMCFQQKRKKKKKKKLWNVSCEEVTLRSLELIFFVCL